MISRRYMTYISIAIFLVFAVFGLAYDSSPATAQQNTEKIESMLLSQFENEGAADFIVVFSEQADLSAAYSMDWDSRGEYVYNTLKDAAERSQVNARAMLDANGLTYQTFIAGNELYVFAAGLPQAYELASLDEVEYIRATRTYYIDPQVEVKPFNYLYWAGDLLGNDLLTTVTSSPEAVVDWGITDTKANQFWSTYGVQGNGIVVANIDTGVQWNHPALDQAYKCGTNPSDPACWFDPTNLCGGSACDNNGHGTHTMGTMVGDDDPGLPYIAGMAPSARWIACKGCASTSCSEASLNACADWILAPGGCPTNRPHIVNNSWGGGGNNAWYMAKVQAWRAAGIFPAFSSGNVSGCQSLGSPGDYQESFASTGHDSTRNHAYSQGPSLFGHTPYTKPNLSAPAVSICSSTPGSSWNCGYSGTSMASPHTAGAVALLWSCNPSLVGQINTTFQLLQYNADEPNPVNPACGVPPDGEGTYEDGYGYLNVLAAGGVACGAAESAWTQIGLPPGCPDWTRYDGEYYEGTAKVYFLGGRSGTNTDGTIYSYNPVSNTCANTGRTMPTPISNYTISLVNNGTNDLLCTFGGREAGGGATLNVQCYNPIANTVSVVTTLPGGWTGYVPGAEVVLKNRVYIFGGFNPNGPTYMTPRTDEYNPITNSFSQKGNLTQARSYILATAVDGKIYAFGGDTSEGGLLVASSKTEVFSSASGTWNDAAVADLPTAVGEGTAYGFNTLSSYELSGKIVVAGGGQWPNETTEAFIYNVGTNTYDYTFPDLNISRRNQAGFFVPGNPGAMWVFGGRSATDLPPHAAPEYYSVNRFGPTILLPLVLRR